MYRWFLAVFCVLQPCLADWGLRGPPKTEPEPKLSSSYIPAAMQIIAHDTELMKYVIKPPAGAASTTTTTLRPTPAHKPALFAPTEPLGPSAYFSANNKGLNLYYLTLPDSQAGSAPAEPPRLCNPMRNLPSCFESGKREGASRTAKAQHKDIICLWQRADGSRECKRDKLRLRCLDYLQLQQPSSGLSYFDRYPTYQAGRGLEEQALIYQEAQKYLGQAFGDVLRLANSLDPELPTKNDESRVQEFSQKFEDSDLSYRFEVLNKKKVPPTKAYVTLLSLYDLLNKEAKRLMLNKFAGYTDEVLGNLVAFSGSTSGHQLKGVLGKVLEKGDTRKADVLAKIKALVAELEMEHSYINEALKTIPPLVFAL
ncbi:hypothetical protein HUJ04_001167 [Dendroctonus ponderosae]|nr:hypothetical protein HUJ04_001167 [Dendroctonus ponderosae]